VRLFTAHQSIRQVPPPTATIFFIAFRWLNFEDKNISGNTANQKKRNLISLQDYQSIWTKCLNNALITKTSVWENGKCYDLGGR
jgi:hypothetical protein